MKYRCSHCNHTFELSDRDFQRCPDCFWTTSLIPLEGASEPSKSQSFSPPPATKPARKFPLLPVLGFFILALAAASIFYFIQKGTFKNSPKKADVIQPDQSVKPAAPKKINPAEIKKILSETEKTQLSRPFQITIPRQVTEDEEGILKKQVSFPPKLSEKPVITPWKKEDFEKMLTTEQKNRKIDLGWGYERSLVKVFEKNYLTAVKSFDAGDYTAARTQFLDSLAFPIYRDKLQLHRAVALVIVRPFINDVIGKVAVLNQYLVGQNYLTEVNSIFSAYQAIFPVMELQEWDKALGMITDLKKQIQAFEQKPKDQAVPLPPSFSALDQEIQNAVQTEASPKPEGAINLKPLTVDLNLKEKVVRSNTPGELAEIQKRYQKALAFIGEGSLTEAKDILMGIEFPPELVDDVRTKLELIEKMLAVSSSHADKSQDYKN